MPKSFFAALLVAIAVTGCSEDAPPPNPAIAPYVIEGMSVPGRLEDAKKSGFTNCSVDYYRYTCTREGKAKIFGVTPVSVSISMDGRDYMTRGGSDAMKSGDVRDIPAEKLSYGGIDIELPKQYENKQCAARWEAKVQRARAGKGLITEVEECAREGGALEFMENLRKSGWVKVHERRGIAQFVKVDSLAAVSVEIFKDRASIGRTTSEAVQTSLQEKSKAEAEAQRRKQQGDAVLEQLKDPAK